jgi:hypothetical protein
VNVLALAVETVAWPDPSGSQLWIMVAVNWAIALAAIPLMSLVVDLGTPVRAGHRAPQTEEMI